MFWRNNNKKSLSSEEFEKLLRRIIDLDGKIASLEITYKKIEADCNNLRGNFNRRLKGIKRDEELEEETEETQNLNNNVILPEDGFIRKYRRSY